MVTGNTSIGARSVCAILSREEEQELHIFLVEAAKVRYPHTCQQAIVIAREIAGKKYISSTIPKVGGKAIACARFIQLML